MKLPLMLINFKTYEQGTGDKAVKLAKICKGISKKYNVNVIICPQVADIFRIASQVKIPIFAQNIDPIEYGSHTGYTLVDAVKGAGAVGTLINHSEKQININEIKKLIGICKKLKLISVCCVPNERLAKQIVNKKLTLEKSISLCGKEKHYTFPHKNKPDFIAVEPPDLIGTGISVSKTRPELIKKIVDVCKKHKINTLCGAGISTGKDVKTAIELGTNGVLVSSAVVKSKAPETVLEDLIRFF